MTKYKGVCYIKRNNLNNLEQLRRILRDETNQFYLYGTGKTGEEFYQQLNKHIKIAGFIESNPVENQKFGLPVYKWGEDLKLQEKDKIIITINTAKFRAEVENRLLQDSLIKNKDFIFYDVARRIITFYQDDIFWLPQIDLVITTACSLNCRDCVQQIPLIKGKRHLSFEEIAESLKDTFYYIDYCKEFHIVGGEPLLHPQLPRIIEHIGALYGKKIETIVIVTNGTILPKEEVVNALNHRNVRVEISDYRESTTAPSGQKIEEITTVLKQGHVSYLLRPMNEWNDYCGDCARISNPPTDDALTATFDICPCSGPTLCVQGKKVYICSRSMVAEAFGLVETNPMNGISLCADDTTIREKLLEFSIKITESGYIPYCINCYGKKTIYERIIPAARQME